MKRTATLTRPMNDHFRNFAEMMPSVMLAMKFAATVHTERWQGVDISNKPEAKMKEVRYLNISVDLGNDTIEGYQHDIGPNLPWADDHFLERVCGEPLNPGKQWANWPYANSANNFRGDHGEFNHTYMERYWPRYAGLTDQGELKETFYDPTYEGEFARPEHGVKLINGRHGIRYRYGDLNDLVTQLQLEPMTRQAYLPIFFPEDTGIANPHRKPCTLGYLFMMRNNLLDITYYIRSCDYVRHFRDDIYLTVRLLLWVLDQLRSQDPRWNNVRPGLFRMDIGSLHMFINDYIRFFGSQRA